jgi:hypothetical protein
MSIVLQSSGGGSVTIQEPATASNFTQTLPAATGTVMVSGNQPAFSAYLTGYQNISSGSYTKVTFDTEEFDTNNNFSSSRFTPTVAGYYQLDACVSCQSVYNTLKVAIYKNGSIHKIGFNVQTNAVSGNVSSVVYANGSTDYFEIYAFFGTTQTAEPSADSTYFNGSLVRSA